MWLNRLKSLKYAVSAKFRTPLKLIQDHLPRTKVASCPLCQFPVEDGIHCLLKCSKLENARFKIVKFLNLWKEENVSCPKHDEEIFQAIINGNSFRKHDGGNKIYLIDNAEHAQRLSMRICSMIMKERDVMINNRLMGV